MKTLVFSLFILTYSAYSQQNENVNYYPVGSSNIWVYSTYSTQWGTHGKIKKRFDSSDVKIGHKFYRCEWNSNFIRVDSATANVFYYDISGGCTWSPFEKTIDSLSAKLGDSLKLICRTDKGRVVDTNIRSVFGVNRQSKHFLTGVTGRVYAKGIGIISMYTGSSPNFYSEELLGCVINGIVYGDTSITGITRTSSEVPLEFSLSQNYPNPFNPSTKIAFNIPFSRGVPGLDAPMVRGGRGVLVRLLIYDALGREITTLVNEQLQPGEYSVTWDASAYPSGVYFYKLESGGFTQTKKMLMLK